MKRKIQLGRSLASFIFFLFLMAIVVKGGLSVLPIYLDQMAIQTIIEDWVEDQQASGTLTRRELTEGLGKRLSINGIRSVTGQDFKIIRGSTGQRFLVGDYEGRVPYFGNIDLVVTFKTLRYDITDITAI